MRTLRFYGASDDLFEIEGGLPSEPDEIGCSGPCTVRVMLNSFGMDAVGLHVTAHYAVAPAAVWMIGISPLDEDIPLPDWPMRWSAKDYSTVLEIDVPDGVEVADEDRPS